MFGQRPEYNSNRPEVHDVLRRWRSRSDSYAEPPLLLGETNVEDLDTLVSFYGSGTDELHLAFNFPFIESPFQAEALSAVVEQMEARLPAGAWPVWTGSNHDVSRFTSRWCQGNPGKVRLAMLMLLTLRGTPVLFQGDEIGLEDGELTFEQLRDPVGLRFWPHYAGRDPARTPMPWDDGPNGGFTSAEAVPWLPMTDPTRCNVRTERANSDSVLTFVHDAIAVRRMSSDLTLGGYRPFPAPHGVWAWQRGGSTIVILNCSDDAVAVHLGHVGRVVLGTRRSREGTAVEGTVGLEPWEGMVVESAPTD
jgi:alpha-glucosidase